MGFFDKFIKQAEEDSPAFRPGRELRITVLANTNGALDETELGSYLDEFGSTDLFVLLGGVSVMDMLKVSWHPQWRDNAVIGVPVDGRDNAVFFKDGSARNLLVEDYVVENVRFGGYSPFFGVGIKGCDVLFVTEWDEKVEAFISEQSPKAVIVGNIGHDGRIGNTDLFGGRGVNRFLITEDGVSRF